MTTDIDAVALERAAVDVERHYGMTRPRAHGMAQVAIMAYLAALASAKPAQAGEYEGLATDLEEEGCMLAASAIRTLEAERAMLSDAAIPADPGEDSEGTLCCRDAFDKWQDQRDRAEAAEARALSLETEWKRGVEIIRDYAEVCEFEKARALSLETRLAAMGEDGDYICGTQRNALTREFVTVSVFNAETKTVTQFARAILSTEASHER